MVQGQPFGIRSTKAMVVSQSEGVRRSKRLQEVPSCRKVPSDTRPCLLRTMLDKRCREIATAIKHSAFGHLAHVGSSPMFGFSEICVAVFVV
jgi:hypothetical protein